MQTDFKTSLTTVLDHVAANPGPALSEDDFVHTVVDGVANGDGRIPEPLFGIPGIPAFAAAAAAQGRHVDLRIKGHEEWERLRRIFRADLQAIVEGRRSADLEVRVRDGLGRVALIPEIPLRGAKEVSFRTVPEGLAAALAYTLYLILRSDRRYQADLKQCRLASCGKFYFMSVRRNADKTSTGVLPKRYCSEEHMLEARRIRETKRTQERRAAGRQQGKTKAKHK
jgi:hypothetical protein